MIQLQKESSNKESYSTTKIKIENDFDRLLKQNVKCNYSNKKNKKLNDFLITSLVLCVGALCMVPVWNINLWQPPKISTDGGGVGGAVPADGGPPDSGIVDSGHG